LSDPQVLQILEHNKDELTILIILIYIMGHFTVLKAYTLKSTREIYDFSVVTS